MRIYGDFSIGSACIALGVLVAGCVFGPRASNYGPATNPYGLTAMISFREDLSPDFTMLKAEVLAVTEEVITVRSATGITSIGLRAIKSATFVEDSSIKIKNGVSSFRDLERLRLQSRFPQGITDSVLERLLASHGQVELIIVP